MINQRTRARLVALAALLTVAAFGCSSTDDDALSPLELNTSTEATSTTTKETTTTTTEPTTTSTETTTTEPETTLQPELDPANWNSDLDEIFGRYLLYWQALQVAFAPPEADPGYAPLTDLTDPVMLTDVQSNLLTYREAGEVLVIPDGSVDEHIMRLPRPVPLDKVEGNEVVIQDCWIADQRVENLEGELVDTLSFPTLWNATMKVIDGEWRVYANVVASDESDGWDECNRYFANLDA